jgi:hypothetical protein
VTPAALADRVVAAAPRFRRPEPVGDRRLSMRLCAHHFGAVRFELAGEPVDVTRFELVPNVADAVVGNVAFLVGASAAEMVANGCPLCFLVDEEIADVVLRLSVKHVLGGAS